MRGKKRKMHNLLDDCYKEKVIYYIAVVILHIFPCEVEKKISLSTSIFIKYLLKFCLEYAIVLLRHVKMKECEYRGTLSRPYLLEKS